MQIEKTCHKISAHGFHDNCDMFQGDVFYINEEAFVRGEAKIGLHSIPTFQTCQLDFCEPARLFDTIDDCMKIVSPNLKNHKYIAVRLDSGQWVITLMSDFISRLGYFFRGLYTLNKKLFYEASSFFPIPERSTYPAIGRCRGIFSAMVFFYHEKTKNCVRGRSIYERTFFDEDEGDIENSLKTQNRWASIFNEIPYGSEVVYNKENQLLEWKTKIPKTLDVRNIFSCNFYEGLLPLYHSFQHHSIPGNVNIERKKILVKVVSNFYKIGLCISKTKKKIYAKLEGESEISEHNIEDVILLGTGDLRSSKRRQKCKEFKKDTWENLERRREIGMLVQIFYRDIGLTSGKSRYQGNTEILYPFEDDDKQIISNSDEEEEDDDSHEEEDHDNEEEEEEEREEQ